jgi:protein-S-isoprenylcysteine O-methyltransferase
VNGSLNGNIAAVLGAIYTISEVGLSLLKRADRGASRLADRGSLLLIWGVILICVTVAFTLTRTLPSLGVGAAIVPLRFIGTALFAIGLTIRWYAIIYLGRFFTVNVAIAADHRLIDGGPYRFVRHPSYTGALMAFLGLGLTLGNWASIAALTVPIFLVFSRRIHVEEAALLQGLGSQYRNYMNRTKRLIPAVY